MAPETPKGVSSRLLTMKFMQRAVASASSNASSDADSPSAKKRKVEHSSPQGRLNVDIDEAAIKAALDDQESTRRAALQQHTATDTEWVLNPILDKSVTSNQAKPAMNIVYVGYGDIDSGDESGDGEDVPSNGRTSTRKPKEEKPTTNSDSDDFNSDSEQADTPPSRKRSASQVDSRSRSQSRSRPTPESLRAKEFRDKRKKKDVQLNKITSISSAGGSPFGSPKSMTCYTCNKPGHRAADCPKKASGNRGRKG